MSVSLMKLSANPLGSPARKVDLAPKGERAGLLPSLAQPPDLRSLEIFVIICRHPSMSAAAVELGMTPSALSHQLSRLERSFGAQLLDRSRRPHLVTPIGEVLRQQAEQIVRRALELPRIIEDEINNRSRLVRLGLIGSLGSEFVPRLIRRLEQRVEQVTVRSELAPDLRAALVARRYDFIISNDPMDDLEGIETYRLLSEPYVVALPPGYPSVGTTAELAALADSLPLIRWRQNSLMGRDIERHLRRNRLRIPHRFEFDGRDTINELVASGLGWAITSPLCLFEAFQRSLRLQVSPPPTSAFHRVLTLAVRSDAAGAVSQWLFENAVDILRTYHLPALCQWLPDIAAAIEIAPNKVERST